MKMLWTMRILLDCFITVNCPVTKKKIFIYPILQIFSLYFFHSTVYRGKCNQVTPPDWIVPFFDFLNYINDFWSTRRSPGAIKISTDSWGDVLHDPIMYVSRSGKFTVFYIPYISHIAQKPSGGRTMKSTSSRIWVGISQNISY